jgi:hypothetical protein
MNRPQARAVAVGLLGFVAMALYVPYREVERVYVVVPVRQPGGELVSMGRTDELREVNVLAAGYYWVWAPPDRERVAWFGTEREISVHWPRLFVQVVVWALIVGAGLVLLRGQAWPSR